MTALVVLVLAGCAIAYFLWRAYGPADDRPETAAVMHIGKEVRWTGRLHTACGLRLRVGSNKDAPTCSECVRRSS